MARNIEIKARIPSVEALLGPARALADGPPVEILQDDTFFTCRDGRLKLRVLGDGTGQLIHYTRPDTTGPKQSDYTIFETPDPAALRGNGRYAAALCAPLLDEADPALAALLRHLPPPPLRPAG